MLANEKLCITLPWTIWGKTTDQGLEPPKVFQWLWNIKKWRHEQGTQELCIISDRAHTISHLFLSFHFPFWASSHWHDLKTNSPIENMWLKSTVSFKLTLLDRFEVALYDLGRKTHKFLDTEISVLSSQAQQFFSVSACSKLLDI